MSVQRPGLEAKWRELQAQSGSPVVRWSLLAIAVISVWVWVVEPLQQWTEGLDAQVSRNAEKAVRMVALERNAQAWLAARQQVRENLHAAHQRLFTAPTDTQAQAAMQGLLREMATARGLTIETQKLLSPGTPESSAGVGTELAVELGMRGELVDLLLFVDDISTAQKLLVVRQWVLQADRRGYYVRLVVAGYRPVERGEVTDA